jgi:hypothetical protein
VTIEEFIEARLAEDEQIAQSAIDPEHVMRETTGEEKGRQ